MNSISPGNYSREILVTNIRKYFMLLSLILIGCEEKGQNVIIDIKEENQMANLTDEEIISLSNIKIFFGHMSVGYDIIEGINDIIKEEPRLKEISILELNNNLEISKAGFYHKKIGKNGLPRSKCDDFKKVLIMDDFGHKLDIAFFKFCYVDFDKNTDVQNVFNYYVHTMDEVKGLFPSLKIIHVTPPLYAHVWGLKGFIRNLLKGDQGNIKRNQFNEMLLNRYTGIDSIYDLTRIESTYPNKNREFFESQNNKYYSLIKDYTYDGGHLNRIGRTKVAIELLQLLASLSIDEHQED